MIELSFTCETRASLPIAFAGRFPRVLIRAKKQHGQAPGRTLLSGDASPGAANSNRATLRPSMKELR
jgi:hypothetical protein